MAGLQFIRSALRDFQDLFIRKATQNHLLHGTDGIVKNFVFLV